MCLVESAWRIVPFTRDKTIKVMAKQPPGEGCQLLVYTAAHGKCGTNEASSTNIGTQHVTSHINKLSTSMQYVCVT